MTGGVKFKIVMQWIDYRRANCLTTVSTQEARVALGYRLVRLSRFFCAYQPLVYSHTAKTMNQLFCNIAVPICAWKHLLMEIDLKVLTT